METIKHEKIILPYPPDSINQVYNFGGYKNYERQFLQKLKGRWQDISKIYLDEAVSEGNIPDHFKGLVVFKFKLYFECWRRRDEDNYFFITKAIMDEFVRSGFIEDDSSEYVHFGGIWLHVDSFHPRIEVHCKEFLRDDQVAQLNYERQDKQRKTTFSGSHIKRRDQSIGGAEGGSGMGAESSSGDGSSKSSKAESS